LAPRGVLLSELFLNSLIGEVVKWIKRLAQNLLWGKGKGAKKILKKLKNVSFPLHTHVHL
jgi:hypothetical protein